MSSLTPAQQFDTDRVFTIPNVLSFIRLLGVPVFCWLIIAGYDRAAIAMLAVFGLTDWFDGYLARRLKQRSPLGAKLDPIADRLYILAAVVALLVRGIVPPWFFILLLARDLMLAGLIPALRKHGMVSLPVNWIGKSATMLLLISLPMILLGSPTSFGIAWAHWLGWVLAAAGAGLYWAAGFMYVTATVRLFRAKDVQGKDDAAAS
ncbi:CDP-alcohol phosphatidyltransferase family protein [Tessaracoccus caeni]|uniref:CDP-alcohol phosphatidyltransferase family protein n=1 Tax=Tessaracoccus caeni TaxID=3031239 RepID=UPI0023DBCA0F|nr:CDP-alcohol phosphatidyltransferase family protein [Tessaracoccus caeni]MDF1488480.1 CDP-alcohol phosphatidyltransferase family protein [Tessaracoccus caeni]